jgi:hypothetical protein
MLDLSNELVMVRRIRPDEFPAWYLSRFGIPHKTAPEVRLADLIADMSETDELWVSHSREIGSLYGHEGVGLVRDGKPIKYEIIFDH